MASTTNPRLFAKRPVPLFVSHKRQGCDHSVMWVPKSNCCFYPSYLFINIKDNLQTSTIIMLLRTRSHYTGLLVMQLGPATTRVHPCWVENLGEGNSTGIRLVYLILF